MSSNDEYYKKMIHGYTNLMIDCAQDLAEHGNDTENPDTLYYKFTRAPADNQDLIREKLEKHVEGLTIPGWAFVVFSEHVNRGQAHLSNEEVGPDPDGGMKPGDKMAAIYELNRQVEVFGTVGPGQASEPTPGLHRLLELNDIELKKYSVLLVFPYYGVAIVEIKFKDDTEIILSSC
ncbi:MAG: hypothetical protein JSV88_28295 [Candidatus Aminicenantes bacterium]|nr:MAG: hypothetical protein JSV88_28295 [Candidatus Aminicenantes bacterium]